QRLLYWWDWAFCSQLQVPGLLVLPHHLTKLGPPRQLLTSAFTRTANGTRMRPSWVCGMCFTLQLPMIISLREDLSPPHPSRSSNPSRPGTGMEQNLKTRLCHLQAEISASGSGRTWV